MPDLYIYQFFFYLNMMSLAFSHKIKVAFRKRLFERVLTIPTSHYSKRFPLPPRKKHQALLEGYLVWHVLLKSWQKTSMTLVLWSPFFFPSKKLLFALRSLLTLHVYFLKTNSKFYIISFHLVSSWLIYNRV